MAKVIRRADVLLDKLEKTLKDLDDDKTGSLVNSPLAHGMAIWMFRHLHEIGEDLNKKEFRTNLQQQIIGFPEFEEEFKKAWTYLESRLL